MPSSKPNPLCTAPTKPYKPPHENIIDLAPGDPQFWQDVAEAAANAFNQAAQLRSIAHHSVQTLKQNCNPVNTSA